MAPFYRIAYEFILASPRSTVTMALSCIISEIKRDIGRKARIFSYFCVQRPGEELPSEYCHKVWWGKTEMVLLPDSEKKFENMFTTFDTMHERDGQTNWHTPDDGVGRAYT